MGSTGKGEGRGRYPSLFWPLLLIAAGVMILLDSLGYIEVSFWELWRYWPVVLILIGLDLLLGRRSRLGSLIVLLLTVVVIGGCVALIMRAPAAPSGGAEVDRISEPLEGAERASLRVESAVGELTVSRLDDSSALIEGDLELAGDRKPQWKVERTGDQASMRLAYESGSSFNIGWGPDERWNLRLSPAVVWEISVKLAAGEGRLDLTGLDLRGLELELGAGQYVVTLPEEMAGKVTIQGGVGSLALEIPETLAARVTVKGAIAPLSMPDRLEKKGDAYVSGDWEGETNGVEIEVTLGIGGITIREP